LAYVVGLTGGIGCGKSSAAQLFAELDAGVIDTDVIAHQLTAAGSPAMEAIRHAFGSDYLLPDGSLDRAKMRQLIFSDDAAKARLEAILHPLIKQRVLGEMARIDAPYLVIVVPLLLETTNYGDVVRRVLVVDCDEYQQLQRTMARSALSAAEVSAIISKQLNREARLKRADDVIHNMGSMEDLRQQVENLHRQYLQRASNAG
jgi:dephospho-CoA kinase